MSAIREFAAGGAAVGRVLSPMYDERRNVRQTVSEG